MPQIARKEVGKVGFGLMTLTWNTYGPVPPTTQSFAAMRQALAQGANLWNAGQFYGPPDRNSLHLLNEYFTKYPEDADKVLVCIKSADVKTLRPDGSEAGIKRSIEECLRILDGKKAIDLFECARVDPETPIETTIEVLGKYVKEGKIGGISLSEVNANTIRRAAKVHKIEAVEAEFSLFSTDILTNGVATACAELGITIMAYSPLSRGVLTGNIKSPADFEEGDWRTNAPRFQKENFQENLKLVNKVVQLAQKKGCTPAQVALGWILNLSGKNGLPNIVPIPGSQNERRIVENCTMIELSDEDMAEIDVILKRFIIKGTRYAAHALPLLEG